MQNNKAKTIATATSTLKDVNTNVNYNITSEISWTSIKLKSGLTPNNIIKQSNQNTPTPQDASAKYYIQSMTRQLVQETTTSTRLNAKNIDISGINYVYCI